MNAPTSEDVASGRPTERPGDGFGQRLVDRITPAIELDPRQALRDMRPEASLREFLTEALEKLAWTLADETVNHPYSNDIELHFAVARGGEDEVVLLWIPRWILEEGKYITCLDEVRFVLENRRAVILSPGLNAPHFALNRILNDWERRGNIRAEFLQWRFVEGMQSGKLQLAEVLSIQPVGGAPPAPPPPQNGPVRDQLFISYSHDDGDWLDRIQMMLAPAEKKGLKIWSDKKKIAEGDQWRDEIDRALASTKVALLLVSRTFLASDFIAENELPPILAAAEVEGVRIFWLCLDRCMYQETPIANYQAAHDVATPLDRLGDTDVDDLVHGVCTKIAAALRA
jgi:hypothetical protein